MQREFIVQKEIILIYIYDQETPDDQILLAGSAIVVSPYSLLLRDQIETLKLMVRGDAGGTVSVTTFQALYEPCEGGGGSK